MVFTEPGPDLSGSAADRVGSPVERIVGGDAAGWVSICGVGVEPVGEQLPYRRMAAAARAKTASGPVVIYGSVLPWRGFRTQAPDIVDAHETYAESFARLLAEQVDDVRALVERYPRELVVWAGDFNQSLEGPNFGGSTAGRVALHKALAELKFEAWNSAARHAEPTMFAIDLVCGPRGTSTRVETIDPQGLSDHFGYIVELSGSSLRTR